MRNHGSSSHHDSMTYVDMADDVLGFMADQVSYLAARTPCCVCWPPLSLYHWRIEKRECSQYLKSYTVYVGWKAWVGRTLRFTSVEIMQCVGWSRTLVEFSAPYIGWSPTFCSGCISTLGEGLLWLKYYFEWMPTLAEILRWLNCYVSWIHTDGLRSNTLVEVYRCVEVVRRLTSYIGGLYENNSSNSNNSYQRQHQHKHIDTPGTLCSAYFLSSICLQ